MTRHRKFAALAAVAALALGACGGDDDGVAEPVAPDATDPPTPTDPDEVDDPADPADPPDPAPDGECPSEGGQITWANSMSFTRGLDPTVALGRSSAGGGDNTAFYDTLMRYDADSDQAVPHVAESLTANDAFTEWTLTLREGITFGNGDPLTAEAVRFNLERLAASTVASSAMAAEIESMTVEDDLTISFTLRRPWGGFDYFFTSEGGMIANPAIVEERGEDFASDPTGAGVGPFELERFAAGEEIVLRAKDDYWGGPVCIDTLRSIHIPGAQATYDAFQAGEVDVFYVQDARVTNQAQEDGVDHYAITVAGSSALLMNQGVAGSTAVTQDERIRRAIAHALDLDTINERAFDGVSIPSSAVFLDGDVEGPEYDPDLARDLVDEAMADGWDGSISFLCHNDPERTELSIAVQASLEAVGITVERENLPPGEMNTRVLVEPNYEVACSGLSVPEFGAISSLNQWESTSTRNRAGYESVEMDAAIEQLMAANTADEVNEAQNSIHEVWNETIPSMHLFGERWMQGYADHVGGLTFTRDSIPMFHGAYLD